jgi:hypothetical protein
MVYIAMACMAQVLLLQKIDDDEWPTQLWPI